MRVALYARVSTEEQKIHGLSIEVQLENLRSWAEENNHYIVGEYVDEGISARKPPSKRPELQRLLSDLDKIDVIAFTKIDRWTRSVKGYYAIQDQLDRASVSWTAIHERYETITTNGRFLVNVMLSVSEQEADRTGDRVKVIVDHKIAKGEYIGAPVPLGYSVVDKRLVPNEDADIVRGAFEAYQLTGRITEAMELLRENGITYTYLGVSKLLRNEMYAGSFRGNDNYCEPIIPIEEFQRTQEMLLQRSARRNQSHREYVFSGLIRCSVCGKPMAGTYRKGYKYRCNHHYCEKTCTNGSITSESIIESALLDKLEDEVSSITAKVAPKKKKRVDNTKKLERLTELYVDGLISKDEYLTRRTALVSVAPPPMRDITPLRKIVLSGDLRSRYDELSRAEKRMLWRSVVKSIYAKHNDIEVLFDTREFLGIE